MGREKSRPTCYSRHVQRQVALSAFAVIFDRSNTPVETDVFERVMQRLKHRGPDGSHVVYRGAAGMGHWHFWTTPEEMGEQQPLQILGLPFTIVLDGRLDNRSDLFVQLDINPAEGTRMSDAHLALRAYDRWGQDCFKEFVGEFAIVIFDERDRKLVCARDPLGDRTLYYSARGSSLVIASEAWAVAGAADPTPNLNEHTLAHYFSRRVTEDGQTFFNGVYELLPAHVMTADHNGQRKSRYWSPRVMQEWRARTNEEYAEQFRSLLEESVRCRLRSTTPVAIQMSGGLDSTSVAALAARMITPAALKTISYIFDEIPESDEREYINLIKTQYGLDSIQMVCDDAWPLKNFSEWPNDPSQPEWNVYRLLFERVYQRAHQDGLRVLLTGTFGDHLYGAGRDWLAELVLDGRVLEAFRELFLHVRHAGMRWTLESGFLTRVARRLLNVIPGGRYVHRKSAAPAWLTSLSVGHVGQHDEDWNPILERDGTLLGALATSFSTSEIFYASQHEVEVRHPYRDRRLVEFVLSLPAYQLYYRGLYKHILRVSMQGILPEEIRTRYRNSSLTAFFMMGMRQEMKTAQNHLSAPNALWPKFIRADWLLKRLDDKTLIETNEHLLFTTWLCAAFEKWHTFSLN